MLDSRFYPHIFDAIVQLTPPAGLLVLRECSRTLRDRAYNRLFEHVEVVLPPDELGIDLTVVPFGSQLSFQLLWDVPTTDSINWSAAIIRRTDLNPKGLEYVERVHVSEYIKKVRVIDLCGMSEYDLYGSHEALQHFLDSTSMTNGPTLRFLGPPNYIAIGVQNAWCLRTRVRECIVFDYAWINIPISDRLVHTIFCRPGDVAAGDKVIINLRLEVGPITGYPLSSSPLEVMVIHLVHSDDTLAPVDTDSSPILHQILSIPFTWETNGGYLPPQVTVVGGAQECRISLGLPPTASDDEFFTALDSTAVSSPSAQDWVTITMSSPDAIVTHWREYVRFISPKEYAAEVGAAQVALETQVDPWSVPAVYIP
ncbi:hypothetical protein CspHIS471_0404190 [Cutaneotrichosporon sp. HIS471]|nr:hypothetical protein CspHIS471_0404190 [Cutaneotrichosporon sp. HIS471]